MNIKEIKKEEDKVVIKIVSSGEEWKKAIDKEMKNACANLKIDGFRKGKVPISEAKKHLNMANILSNAANKAINNGVLEIDNDQKVKNLDVEVYPSPSVNVTDINESELVYDATYWINPKITIDNYKNLDVNIKTAEASNEEIDNEINALMNREKMLVPLANSKIENGHQVEFDFVGFIDGKEFPGGKAEKYKLEIGSKQFIPGFEEAMIGLKVGDEKDINISFPKTYHAKDLAGKPVTFKVKIHNINKVEKPVLDDKFVKSLKFNNVNTVDELRNFLANQIIAIKKQQFNQENIVQINKAIFNNSKYKTIPLVMIEDEKSKIYQQYQQQLQQMKLKEDDFLKMVHKTKAQIQEELTQQAKSNIVVYGALDYIIQKEKIDTNEKEIKERYDLISKSYNTPIEKIKKSIDEEAIEEIILHEKALLKIIEWNTKKEKTIKK